MCKIFFLDDFILLTKPILLKNRASTSVWHERWNHIVVFCLELWRNLDFCLILHLEFENGHVKLNTRPKWMKFRHTVNMSCTWDFNEEQSQTESKLVKKYLCLKRGLQFSWPSLSMPDYSHCFNFIGTRLATSKHPWDAKNFKNKVNVFGASGFFFYTTKHYWIFLLVKKSVKEHQI